MPRGADIETDHDRGLLAGLQDRLARSDVSARLHARAFRASRGRLGAVVQGKPVLLLATTGRRSGERREVVVMFVRDGDRYLVVPSNAADPDRPPAWWRNLQATPTAEVLVDGGWRDVHAAALPDADRDRWWPTLVAHNPNWARFQAETARRFPVVALSPAAR